MLQEVPNEIVPPLVPELEQGPTKFHGPLELLFTAISKLTDVPNGTFPFHVIEFNCAPLATPVSNVCESSVPVAGCAVHTVATSYG
jgi:hypothetical protein